MNHPTPEDWMTHLYGETPAPQRAELEAHLRQCAACATRVKGWRASMGALDAWTLPASRRARGTPGVWRWAAAAAVVLAAGFAVGRFSGTEPRELQAKTQREFDTKLAAMREEFRTSTAAELRAVLTDFGQELDDKRSADAQSFLAALRQVDARFGANFNRLRRDLDTVAVVADGRLSDTQEQLEQLASAGRPATLLPSGND